MLAPSPVVKQTAKNALSQCFLTAIAVSCLLLFIYCIGGLIASMVSIFADLTGYIITLVLIAIFALSPLTLGVLYYFRRLIWEGRDSVLIIFKYFSSLDEYKRALHFTLLIFLRLVITALVTFSPCIVVWVLSNDVFYEALGMSLPIWASNLWALNSVIAIFSSFVLVFIMLRFYLAPFIFVASDDIDSAEAVNMSSIISKRTGGDFFGLVLSFAGWIVISLFVAPLVFTVPYFAASYCVHCRFAITAYNRDVDRFNASSTPSYSTDEF